MTDAEMVERLVSGSGPNRVTALPEMPSRRPTEGLADMAGRIDNATLGEGKATVSASLGLPLMTRLMTSMRSRWGSVSVVSAGSCAMSAPDKSPMRIGENRKAHRDGRMRENKPRRPPFKV